MDRYEDLSDCEVDDHSFFDSDFGEQSKPTDYTPAISKQTEEPEGDRSLHVHNSDLTVGKSAEEYQSLQEESDKEEQIRKHYMDDQTDKMTNSSATSVTLRQEYIGKDEVPAQSIKINTVIPTGIPKIRREHEDKYETDVEDSSDDGGKKRLRPKSAKQSNSLKKSIGKKYSHFSASSSSSDADCLDTESESYVLEPSNSSLSRKSSRSIKSLEENSKLRDYAEESEDTVTDVTPLSTPDISPIQSFDLAATSEMLKKNKIKRQENVSQEIYDPNFDEKYNEKALHDAMDLNQLLKAFMRLDKKEQRSLVTETPTTKIKKNYSFTKEEVRQIDRENQRLLKELSRQNSMTRSSSTSIKPKKLSCPPIRLYHSAVNRQREQQRIEKDNLALLKSKHTLHLMLSQIQLSG
ncbi:cilia- and flagella-associated protein 97 isoform X2 [Rhinatrema bivittatum]|uniref:cilia- and flagella-associated protein 97 isoform X2 n=1 Tax=Rhinatrema bivittatum TaxID=194408 RepID=UPI00112DFD8F|nr:cilia- and flagella-associated protein 97 isoform X2 [Rhinatrema bivittatum]